jgi:hypothetical protein
MVIIVEERTASKHTTLAEEKLDDIGDRLQHCLRKFLRLLAKETWVRSCKIQRISEDGLQRINAKILQKCKE